MHVPARRSHCRASFSRSPETKGLNRRLSRSELPNPTGFPVNWPKSRARGWPTDSALLQAFRGADEVLRYRLRSERPQVRILPGASQKALHLPVFGLGPGGGIRACGAQSASRCYSGCYRIRSLPVPPFPAGIAEILEQPVERALLGGEPRPRIVVADARQLAALDPLSGEPRPRIVVVDARQLAALDPVSSSARCRFHPCLFVRNGYFAVAAAVGSVALAFIARVMSRRERRLLHCANDGRSNPLSAAADFGVRS